MQKIDILEVTERLRTIIKAQNMKFNDVANLLGMKKQSFHSYVDGTRLPPVEALFNLSKLLGVSMEYILTGEDKSNGTQIMDSDFTLLSRLKNLNLIDQERIRIYIDICESTKSYNEHLHNDPIEEEPVYYESAGKNTLPILGKVAAGEPIEIIQVPLGYLKSPISADYVLIAKGNSMSPVIQDGEYVFVKQISNLDHGEMGIFYINGETTCKIFYRDTNKVILKSLNPNFKPFEYSLNSSNDLQILGKVVLSSKQKDRYKIFS